MPTISRTKITSCVWSDITSDRVMALTTQTTHLIVRLLLVCYFVYASICLPGERHQLPLRQPFTMLWLPPAHGPCLLARRPRPGTINKQCLTLAGLELHQLRMVRKSIPRTHSDRNRPLCNLLPCPSVRASTSTPSAAWSLSPSSRLPRGPSPPPSPWSVLPLT